MSVKLTHPILNAPSPAAQKLELLRELFPQAIETEPDGSVRVNAAAIQQALDPVNPEGIRVEEDGYELRWVGKREAYHTAFVPPQKILKPLQADSQDWDATGNLLIKGDNLDALRLLRQSYFGKVKLIYIDPPYNTQSDAFIYRDDFTARQGEVLKQLGYSADNIDYIKNIYGARTHSGWLSFMYPRLLLAKDLLRDDGVIFISIDDNEQAQLKLLCDEVFGAENFVANVIWHKRYAASNDSKDLPAMHDYMLIYQLGDLFQRNLLPRTSKQDDLYKYDDSDGKGKWRPDNLSVKTVSNAYLYSIKNPTTGVLYDPPKGRCWLTSQEKMATWIEDKRVFFGKDGTGAPQLKRYLSEVQQGIVPTTYWSYEEVGHTDNARKELKRLFDGAAPFDNPKPSGLIKKTLLVATGPGDIVLDFFGGSGTTADAVMQLNAEDDGKRQFILVQIPQPIDPKKQKEAHSFVTDTLGKPEATIFEITAERIRRAGAKLKADKPDLDTGFRVFALADDPDALILQKPLSEATQADLATLQASIATPQPEQLPRVLYNLLLAEGLPLSTRIVPLREQVLYRAGDVLLILREVDTEDLGTALAQMKTEGTPIAHLCVYAPWVQDNNFLLGTKTLLETLGLSEDKLRLRG